MASIYYIYRNYDYNDGTSVGPLSGPLPQITDVDEPSLDPVDWSRDNYDFLGWNTSSNGSGTMYQPGDTPSNSQVFAIWKNAVVVPDVTISYNGNTIASLSDSGTEVLETNGKLCEDDITIDYTKPSPSLQNKTVSPTTSQQTITADTGYDGLSQVTVNAISPTKSAQIYTPTTTDQTISSGRWLTGTQTIKGDANLVAGNIKKNVQIFNVTGTYEGSGGGGGETADHFIENHDLLSSYSNSTVNRIGDATFAFAPSLTSVDFSACESIGSRAFYCCSKLKTVSFPNCSYINYGAFWSCDNSAFSSVYFPECSGVSNYGFAYCRSLTDLSFPALREIGYSAFIYCIKLSSATFPACLNVYAYAFNYCNKIETLSFPVLGNGTGWAIGQQAFSKCNNLTSLYILGSSVATLANSNAFTSTPIAGYTTSTGGVYGSIYVPSSLLSSYKTATNWTYFSSRFVGI